MGTKTLMGAASRPLMLSILHEGPSYGYAIVQRLHDLSGGAVAWADGTLYPVLHRLEDEGLIASAWQTSDEGRRRKYYRLTPLGTQALEGERTQWLEMDAILARLWGLEPRVAL